MNSVQLTGNLTQDPQLRKTRSDTSVAQMRLAVTRPRKDGEDQGADYVDVTVFGPQAENCVKYLAKGKKVGVEGRLHHSEWQSDTGRRQRLEVTAERVEFLTPPTRAEHASHPPEPVAAGVAADGDGEDIPF
jgi:single-strand DNA-binding protein